jgi:hypothetical protein
VAISVDQLVRELRGFDRRGEVIKSMKVGIRKPVPAVRKAIKARAKSTLPRRGGLGAWVAASRVNVEVKLTGRKRVGIRLKGGRNSKGGRSDIAAIDRGRVRAPSWGHRTAASWHSQTVPAGFFTTPAGEATQWRDAVETEVDRAFDTLRRG